ncbi:hypothetical protein WJX81_005397 [Elliptochloris bilobata]|uniref:Protein MCM10 homolog n=1 Tax=Elliptochloris bilobata TaxID=381761 RepID=A0AAW1RB64_9CHLO
MRMRNPVFPAVILAERFARLDFLKLGDVKGRLKGGKEDGAWATVGVLVSKSAPRESASGNMFSIWRLSDLDGATESCFLFGEAHQDHYREAQGAVVALFNARARREGSKFDLSIETGASVLKLGTSADMGFCNAQKKSGGVCGAAVNKSRCAFCDYHVQSEFKRMHSRRGPLQDSHLGGSLKPHLRRAAQRVGVVAASAPIQRATPAEMLRRLAASGMPRSSHGARLAAAYAQSAADVAGPAGARGIPAPQAPSGAAARVRAQGPAAAGRPGPGAGTPSRAPAAGSRGPAQDRAGPRWAAGAGPQSHAPGKRHKRAPRGAMGAAARGKARGRPAAVGGARGPLVVPHGVSEFAAAFGSVVAGMEPAQSGTRYKELVEDEEAARLARVVGALESKDAAQQRMAAITKLPVGAWRCAVCQTTSERRRPECKAHAGSRVTASKRWWACTGCGHRFTTVGVVYPKLGRCPSQRCPRPDSQFRAVAMGREGRPPTVDGVAARAAFQPRGREHAFALNTLAP